MSDDALAEARAAAWNVLNNHIADHPMWTGDDGQPLDYSPEREARIHDFIAEVSHDVAHLIAAAKAEAWDEGMSAAKWADRGPETNPYRAALAATDSAEARRNQHRYRFPAHNGGTRGGEQTSGAREDRPIPPGDGRDDSRS